MCVPTPFDTYNKDYATIPSRQSTKLKVPENIASVKV